VQNSTFDTKSFGNQTQNKIANVFFTANIKYKQQYIQQRSMLDLVYCFFLTKPLQ